MSDQDSETPKDKWWIKIPGYGWTEEDPCGAAVAECEFDANGDPKTRWKVSLGPPPGVAEKKRGSHLLLIEEAKSLKFKKPRYKIVKGPYIQETGLYVDIEGGITLPAREAYD